jgi:large subunit ribosomal protein L5
VAEDKGKKKAKQKAPEGEAKEAAAPKEKVRKELKPKVPSEIERRYHAECVPALMKEFGFTNRMQVPRLEKIVINTCIKEALQDVKILETAASEIAAITGQRPAITKSKKSISNFKLRKGQSLGARVTLRGKRMYDFLNRLVNVAMPRVRDFKGVPAKAFDGRGNYTLGLTDQTIFPEINFDKVSRVNGMNLTFVTSARTDAEGMALLKLLGMPFRTA